MGFWHFHKLLWQVPCNTTIPLLETRLGMKLLVITSVLYSCLWTNQYQWFFVVVHPIFFRVSALDSSNKWCGRVCPHKQLLFTSLEHCPNGDWPLKWHMQCRWHWLIFLQALWTSLWRCLRCRHSWNLYRSGPVWSACHFLWSKQEDLRKRRGGRNINLYLGILEELV